MAAEVHTEGLQFLLEVALSEEQSVPANFYMGLATDASLDEADGLSDLTEVSGAGYSRQTVASNNTDFTSAATGTNDRKTTTATQTFTATGDWTGANTVFLGTTSDNSGKLICSAPLSATRELVNTDTLQVALEITLTG